MENVGDDSAVEARLKEALKKFEGKPYDPEAVRKAIEETLLGFVTLPGARVEATEEEFRCGSFRVEIVTPAYRLRVKP